MARGPGAQAWMERLRGARGRRATVAGVWPASGAVDLETCAQDLARRQTGAVARQNIPDLRRAVLEHERSLRRAYVAARLAVSEQRRIEPAARSEERRVGKGGRR